MIETPEVPTYRQSEIAAFDSCALRVKLGRESPLRTPSVFAARGSLLHRFFHQASKKMRDRGEQSFPVDMGMELLLDVLCQHDVPAEEVIPIPMEQMRWCRVLATKWCENVRFDARRILEVESRLYANLDLPTGETVRLTGQLDILLVVDRHTLEVRDWKTGPGRPPTPRDPDKAEQDGSGLTALGWAQWLIYSFLVFENYPSCERVTYREIHVLRNEERYATMERWKYEQVRDPLAAQISMLHQAVQEGPDSARWVPTAGGHCALCPAPRRCPILDDEDIVVDTPEGRQRVAQEWIVAGEVRKRRRAILDGLVDVYGPIPVLHSEGRRVVGWDVHPDGTRNFKVFEPREVNESPWDDVLAEATREAGVLVDG